MTDNPPAQQSDDPIARRADRRERERVWFARMCAGDEQAFEMLYRTYYRPLLMFVLPMIGTHAAAEEVVEDVFVQIWQRRDSIQIQHAVNTYLFTLARNRALNVGRRQRMEQRWIEQAKNHRLESHAAVQYPVDERHLDADRVLSVVQAAIDSLPEQRRRVLQLRWQQGMSYAEIAAVVGSSVIAVERQLNRTLKALRLILPEWLSADDRPSI